MPDVFAVVQCRNQGAVPTVEREPIDVAVRLHVMTNGFRTVFGRVFAAVWELGDCPATLRWLDEDVRVGEAYLAHSDAGRLEGLEGDNWLLVLRLEVDGDAQAVRDRMNDVRATRGAGVDRAIFQELADALGECEATRLFGQLTFEVPDTKLSALQPSDEARIAMPLLVAFYYLGLMIVHRIDRDQVRAEMPIEPGYVDEASVDAIAKTRVRLANVNRFFLTTNRSQLPEVRDVCVAIAERMNLAGRYERQVTIHHDMERHLDNIAQIAQVRSSRETQAASERTNSVLFYLTIIGLPLAVFSAVMTFSLDAPLVRDPDRWPTWATFLVALGASASVSLILLGVMVFIANGRRRACDVPGESAIEGRGSARKQGARSSRSAGWRRRP